MKTALSVALCCLISSYACAGEPAALVPLNFLLGDWVSKGQEPAGRTTFAHGLQDRVIIRTNFAQYPESNGKPGLRHDDLMIIYTGTDSLVKAEYYDNEGHVIRYAVHAAGTNDVVFISAAEDSSARYRLRYKLAADGRVHGSFEIAPPGRPDAFFQYLAWDMQRD